MTETTVPHISAVALRERRERLHLSRIAVAIRAQVNPGWLAALEAGYQPASGDATGRVLDTLDMLEAERREATA